MMRGNPLGGSMPRFLAILLFAAAASLPAQEVSGPELSNYEVLAEAIAHHTVPGLVILDVRSKDDYLAGHIPGALSYPFLVADGETSPLFNKFPSNSAQAPLVVYGRPASSDARKAADILRTRGYRNVILFGSISQWKGKLE
jgi:rhodanese-related sulfurtransferase